MSREKWEKIELARKLLGLREKTSIVEIKEAYRKLSRKWHPDHQGDVEQMQALNDAYQTLMDYCERYKIKLSPCEEGADPEEWWMLRFGEDPIWSGERGKS